MPVEAKLLRDAAPPWPLCPNCSNLFIPMMRGCIQRYRRRWWWPFTTRDYCALICSECKQVVGYESPRKGDYEAIESLYDDQNGYGWRVSSVLVSVGWVVALFAMGFLLGALIAVLLDLIA